MPLPEVTSVKQRINDIPDKALRFTCTAAYLWAARISEVVSQAYGKEKAYGSKASEVMVEDYQHNEVAVFDVHTAKRQGQVRKIALPLEYIPDAKPLLAYFESFEKKDYVFPFHRQYVWKNVVDEFAGLAYPIETYTVMRNGQMEKVPSHQRRFNLHALRHLRATELVEHYGFDGFNLAAYGGWTIRTAQAFFGASIPGVISRYLYLNWQGYINKLLRK